jgi:hypothetical protein
VTRDKPAKPSALPVDVDRLRAEFPDLTDAELEAYRAVTGRVLGDPAARAAAMREVMAEARAAREKAASAAALSAEEQQLVVYLSALDKMQRSTVRRS